MFLLSFEVLAIGVFSILDGMLSLFVTAAILLLHFAYEQQAPRPRLILLVLAGVACGLAFLTKGFLALAVPVIVIVPFALWQGRLRICLRTAWVPLVTAFLVVLPWALAIHGREPDFWRYFFWVEHVERFTSPRGDSIRRLSGSTFRFSWPERCHGRLWPVPLFRGCDTRTGVSR